MKTTIITLTLTLSLLGLSRSAFGMVADRPDYYGPSTLSPLPTIFEDYVPDNAKNCLRFSTLLQTLSKDDALAAITAFSCVFHATPDDYPNHSFIGILTGRYKSTDCGFYFDREHQTVQTRIQQHIDYFAYYGELTEKFTKADTQAAFDAGKDETITESTCHSYHLFFQIISELNTQLNITPHTATCTPDGFPFRSPIRFSSF